MANEGCHEPTAQMRDATRDMHRAIVSSREELGAVLAHNRDEEKEHAAMLLEWIRRRDPAMDHELKDYLFTDIPIAHS